MNKPIISVIVPVYNTEKYLHRCIDSILAQTFTDFELLLIDDGSKDNSGKICDEYAAKDSRVRVFHKENGGVSSARNLGLDNAQGEWIAFVDSDDYISPQMYELLYKKSLNDSSELVYCDIYMIYKDTITVYKSAQYNKSHEECVKNWIISVWTSCCIFIAKKRLYTQNNLKSPIGVAYAEDFWLSTRLFHYAQSISKVELPLYYYYRINPNSAMHKLNTETENNERNSYVETIDFFKSLGILENYEKEMCWRILKSTHDSIYQNRHNEFLSIYPKAHSYIWSCPYVNAKSKILMWMLTHHMQTIALAIIQLRRFRKL